MTHFVTPSPDTELISRQETALALARQYRNQSRSDNTWRAYECDWKRFCSWCESLDYSPLPATPDTVSAFLATDAAEGRAPSTIARRLAAIRLMHIASGHPSPHETIEVMDALAGIRNVSTHEPRSARAASDADIRRLADVCIVTTNRALRNRALLLMGFDSGLRRSELVGIDVDRMDRHDEGLAYKLRHSKNIAGGKSRWVLFLKRSGSAYCPVNAFDTLVEKSSLQNGALFRRIHAHDRVGKERLGGRSVANMIKSCARRAGFSDSEANSFAGHSLRSGLITSAYKSEQDMKTIMDHVGHKRVDTTFGYVQIQNGFANHPGRELLW